ncbi:hypothetical protein [Amycolatopsis plumensis]|uniref:hypothetical protein n=1 Tax=Amycolatopsis plumensis TaxID=236508 RepID=UPI00360EC851
MGQSTNPARTPVIRPLEHSYAVEQSERAFCRVVVEGRHLHACAKRPHGRSHRQVPAAPYVEIGSMASVGVSSTHVGAAGIRAGYFEALAAAEAGRACSIPALSILAIC